MLQYGDVYRKKHARQRAISIVNKSSSMAGAVQVEANVHEELSAHLHTKN